MPNNYVLLETIALTQSATSVTFDNLPTSGYTDLKVVISARTDFASGNDNIKLSFNGSTASFSAKRLYGSGSAAASDTLTDNTSGIVCNGATSTASTFSSAELYVPNYLSSNNKSYSSDSVAETNATTTYMYLVAGLRSNTAAISSITFTPQGGTNFVANSTFSLYGVAAFGTTPVLAPKATGGNIVANDGTYWYHAFTSSGNFVPQVGLTADVLQIAGGGGGGAYNESPLSTGQKRGSAAGAGGLLAFIGQSLAAVSHTVTVGAGGAGTTGNDNGTQRNGSQGANSQFASLTASVGGGRGVGFQNAAGGDGGSGGGGMNGGAGGNPTSGQGFAGGAGAGSFSGGGGGAGGAGVAAVFPVSQGNGGVGSSSYSSWGLATGTGQNVSGTVYYAGGGGNTSVGAFGGGGSDPSKNGTPNTGGGGAGDSSLSNGNPSGNGGSGIVIIRYTIA